MTKQKIHVALLGKQEFLEQLAIRRSIDELIIVYAEEETELAAAFGIRSIPSILFIPASGQPQMALGALPKETLIKAFKDVLGVEK